jgi:recombinational DNA repair protein (RecF pathway)
VTRRQLFATFSAALATLRKAFQPKPEPPEVSGVAIMAKFMAEEQAAWPLCTHCGRPAPIRFVISEGAAVCQQCFHTPHFYLPPMYQFHQTAFAFSYPPLGDKWEDPRRDLTIVDADGTIRKVTINA